jgi:hypothetical protein
MRRDCYRHEERLLQGEENVTRRTDCYREERMIQA